MKQFINFFKPILFGVGVVAVLETIVFPGLSTDDTIVNILSLLIGIALMYVVIKYVESFFKNEQLVVIEEPKSKPKPKQSTPPPPPASRVIREGEQPIKPKTKQDEKI